MRRRGASGVWEIFLPGITRGEIYRYEIVGAYGHLQPLKTDPRGLPRGGVAADRLHRRGHGRA